MSNQTSFQFSVNGKKDFEIPSPDGTGKFSASELLKQISEDGAFDELPKSGENVGFYALKVEGSGKQYAGEEQIDLHDEKEFTLVQILYPFEVSGAKFTSGSQKITAQEVLDIARKGGAIPSDTGPYELQLAGGRKKFNNIDTIDLAKFHTFLAINVSSTRVAS